MENFQEELIKALGNLKNFVPVGTPWWGFDVKAKPIGVQLYQGQVLARSMYPVHWNYIQSYRTIVSDAEWHTYADAHGGFCPYFSSGDDVGTYRMPKIVDVHPRFCYWGDDVGKYVEAGLPNIVGSYYGSNSNNDNGRHAIASGAMYEGVVASTKFTDNTTMSSSLSGTLNSPIMFDAHRSTHIYGQSDTVQPPAVNMLVGEYVVSGVSEIDIATENEILSGIQNLETQVGNVINKSQLDGILAKYNTAYITETWSSGTEWYRKWSNGWIEQGGKTGVMKSNVITTITLYKTMKDTNYNVTTCERYDSGTSDSNNENYWISTISNTSFGVYNSAGGYKQLYWQVCGY
jgi:hypothetical protein